MRLPTAALCCLFVFLLVPGPTRDACATDLGEGNAAAAKLFDAYTKGGHRVKASEAKRRVMITGFGLFSGVDFNISGVVAESMANAKAWPAAVKLAGEIKVPEAAALGKGTLTGKDGGARVWQRTLTIDGEKYEVCFLVLDVLWDLGAAITLWEAQTFQPHLIVMTGRGGKQAIFEKGALNRAIPYSGFLADGRPDKTNTPVTGSVLDPKKPGIEDAIGMTWDNARLAAAAKPVVDAMKRGYEVVAAPAARERNTYICNNISCVVLHGLKGEALELAGGKIKVGVKGLEKTTAGFFHYPAAATRKPEEILGWMRMLATVVKTHFTQP